MPIKTKVVTSTLALLIGVLIFGTSLLMASQVRSKDFPRVSERRLYFSNRILPDHLLYPVLMIADRVILNLTFGDEKIYVKLGMAEDRLKSAKILLEKNQEELALSTMTKSQKYLFSAANDFLQESDQSEAVKQDLLASLIHNYNEMKECRNNFEVIDTTPISDLLTESEALISQLN